MLTDAENKRLEKEEYQLGEAISKFMESKHIIGIFSNNKNKRIVRWLNSKFDGICFDTCRLFDPTDNNVSRDQDMNTYDGIIFTEIKFNMSDNHIKYNMGKIDNVIVPVFHIIYEVDIDENNEELYQGDQSTG